MTKTTKTLAELKKEVILYHTGDNLDYLHKNISRDACYTSYNSLQYKKKQMADAMTDYETNELEGRDAPQLKLFNMIERMEVELTHLEERHIADLWVYQEVNEGEIWEYNKPKSSAPKLKSSKFAALKKRVAA